MKGQVEILLATQYKENKFVQIFRALYYEYTPGDLNGKTEEALQYWFLKENISKVNTMVQDDDVEGIIVNLNHIKMIYTNLPNNLAIVQRRMPRLLIVFYEKIYALANNIDHLIHVFSETVEMLAKLIDVRKILDNARRKIMLFWKNDPEVFFRMQLRIIEPECSVELFQSDLYIPYIVGIRDLPLWTDPSIVLVINDTRKIIQTREQTKVQRKDYYVILRLITQKYNFDWAIKMIIDYLPISLLFDLMVSQTPYEFSLGKSRTQGEISIWVS
uniref:Uncharacterized protein n=1 Tax=viral metagenome TaxID=1070528 RepID=A0A6C0HRY1_9ZZZZ